MNVASNQLWTQKKILLNRRGIPWSQTLKPLISAPQQAETRTLQTLILRHLVSLMNSLSAQNSFRKAAVDLYRKLTKCSWKKLKILKDTRHLKSVLCGQKATKISKTEWILSVLASPTVLYLMIPTLYASRISHWLKGQSPKFQERTLESELNKSLDGS